MRSELHRPGELEAYCQPSKRLECDPDGRTYRTDANPVSPWPALSFAIMLQPGAFRSIGSILLTEATLFHRRHL